MSAHGYGAQTSRDDGCLLQPGYREHAMLPSTYQTQPTAADQELQRTGRKVLNAFTQYAGGSSELWRLVVTARTMHVPPAQDATLLTYAHTPPGIMGVWTNFRERPIGGATLCCRLSGRHPSLHLVSIMKTCRLTFVSRVFELFSYLHATHWLAVPTATNATSSQLMQLRPIRNA